MHIIKLYFLLCIIVVLSSCNSSVQTLVESEKSALSIIDQKVDSVMQLMTLEEKVGQMNQYSSFYDVTGPAPIGGDAAAKYDQLRKGFVGSMLNVRGVEQVRKIQKIAVEESRLGIPLIFAFDVIHGFKTIMPIPLAESSSWDLEAIEKSARISAIEASAAGLNWTFAPMVDIGRDARWGRVMEGAGEDPYLGTKVALARVQGFQGDDLSAPNSIAACAKHFAAYGFAESGRDYNTADIGTNTLYNMVLPPFEALAKADVKSFMNSFNILNGIPATGDAFLLREILKQKWNYDGFVVSDWGSITEMQAHGFASDLKSASALAAKAGCDMDMESNAYITHLVNNINEGTVKEANIDDAVRRILKVKFELGLFDDPYKYCDLAREKDKINHLDHHSFALSMAQKSIVLLRNEKELLPLKKNQKNILVIGELANDKNSPLGNWRLAADDNTAVSVLEGFSALGVDFQYVQGPKIFAEKTNFFEHVKIEPLNQKAIQEAVDAAKNAEVVVMVLGEHGYMSGEGRSKTNLDLPSSQLELLKAVHVVNKNIVLVLMNGRPMTINWEDEHISAILETWQLGSQSGHAIASTLFGDYNPSGKLTMSFPRSVGQLPLYYNHSNTGRPGPLDQVFWSHYGDEKNTPLYPFGYGLSYTSFEYSNLKIDTTNLDEIQISVTVSNTGKFLGEEVVQLYLTDTVASIVRPVKELKGFQKISIAPGTKKNVRFTLTKKELGFYNHNYEWLVEPGQFTVLVGTNSQDGLKGDFEYKN